MVLETSVPSGVETVIAEASTIRPRRSLLRSTSCPAMQGRAIIPIGLSFRANEIDQASFVVEVGSCEEGVLLSDLDTEGQYRHQSATTISSDVDHNDNRSQPDRINDFSWYLSRNLNPFSFEGISADLLFRGINSQLDDAQSSNVEEMAALDGSRLQQLEPVNTAMPFIDPDGHGEGHVLDLRLFARLTVKIGHHHYINPRDNEELGAARHVDANDLRMRRLQLAGYVSFERCIQAQQRSSLDRRFHPRRRSV